MLFFANDKIRIHYWIPVLDASYHANFTNSLGRQYPGSQFNLTTIFFKRSSEFSAQITCEFDSDLHDLKSFYAMMHTYDSCNSTKFDSWNFSNPYNWDSVEAGFWFDHNTTILVFSDTYIIG